MAVTSLHYYFPWAMTALLRWTAFCTVTGREPRVTLGPRDYFAIGDRDDLSYEEKLQAYRRLADEHFELDAYREFCDTAIPHAHEVVLEWVGSPEFDELLIDTVRATYPEHEHERFAGHFRGLVGQWLSEQPQPSGSGTA